MINKRLIKTVPESKKYIAMNVIFQWISLCANIVMIGSIVYFLQDLYFKNTQYKNFLVVFVIFICCVFVRFLCSVYSNKMSFLSSKSVKKILRELIYKKLLKIGSSYSQDVKTSEIVQISVEGVEQLETYFGAYLPQFFYSMLAPLTLFAVLSFIDFFSAFVLFICVFLIPISIALVQTFAKKLLSKYWGQYTELGDTFLENLQGLTTLKIYQADEFKNRQMNDEAEKFRKITMKVLTMQLNSITVMDLVAYGGAGMGIILSVLQFSRQKISIAECLMIVLLSAEYFIPMRQLGSFFHIAMNGMAASEKIFKLIDLPENSSVGDIEFPNNSSIEFKDVSFSYDKKRNVLNKIDMKIQHGSFVAIVGESGCGKSTIASILTAKNKNYDGDIFAGDVEFSKISEKSLMDNITYLSHNSYLFKGTVRENLLMAKPNATDREMLHRLKQVKLYDFLQTENSLDTKLKEKGSNLSGGQRQRLAIARALLHDSNVYIFDEATSNIDVESENDIMNSIYELAKVKTVIVISHRLANIKNADEIYVLKNGSVCEKGTHQELLENENEYFKLWNIQQSLENYERRV